MKKQAKNIFHKTTAVAAVLFCLTAFNGCGAEQNTEGETGSSDTQAVSQTSIDSGVLTSDLELITIKDSDTDTVPDPDATVITLNKTSVDIAGSGASADGSVITITEKGDYVISGTLENGRIIIDAGEEKVHLFLNNADITCSDSAPIYGISADKVIITLMEGTENKLTDGASYVYETADADEPNAALFSKDDLSINGTGSLTINANYNNGITCKDDLKIVGGDITVTAVNHGIKGKDSLTICDAVINVTAGGDGLKTSNSEDSDKGYLHIISGSITIDSEDDAVSAENNIYIDDCEMVLRAADDAVHTETDVTISSGTILIETCYEGIEGANIIINGGEISIFASDDGINAASSSTAGTDGFAAGRGKGGFMEDDGSTLIINGGAIYVNASGDGIDSNGSVTVNGGVIVVDGPSSGGDGALDYGSSFTMNGGYLFAVGASGMAVSMTGGTQCSALLSAGTISANETITLADSDGNIIAGCTPSKTWQALNISTPELAVETDYILYRGGTVTGTTELGAGLFTGGSVSGGTEITSYTQSTEIYSMSSGGMGGMGGFGGKGQGGFGGQLPDGGQGDFDGKERPGDRQEDFGGEMPDDLQKDFGGELPDDLQKDFDGEMPKDGQKDFDGQFPADDGFEGQMPPDMSENL